MTRRRTVFVVAAVAAAGALVWWLLRAPSEQPFHDHVAAMRAAGRPTTFEEFAGPMPSDADNAAPEIDAAIAAAEQAAGAEADWPDFGEESTDAALPAASLKISVAAFAAKLGPFAERVEAALSRPRFRYPIVKQSNGYPLDPHVMRLIHAIRFLSAIADSGPTTDGRLAACRALLRIGIRYEADTAMEHAIASHACACGARGLRGLAESSAVDARRLREQFDGDLATPWLPRIARVYTGDRVWLTFVYDATIRGTIPSSSARLGVLTTAKQRFTSFKERLAGKRVSIDFEPGHPDVAVAALEFVDAVSKLPARNYSEFRTGYDALAASTPLAWTTFAENHKLLASRLAESELVSRLARVALAVASHRAEHGAFPDSLDVLRPAFGGRVPTDPLYDRSFRYARMPEGVRIWSSGDMLVNPPKGDKELRERGFLWELKR